MDKRQRFIAASNGEKPDRPPVGCWIHFGSARWEPALAAEAHLRFLHEYDWDYLKVMNDYRMPTAGGVREAFDVDDLACIGGTDVVYDNFDKQLAVLKILREKAPDVALLDTVFSPMQTVVRTLGDSVIGMFKQHPDVAEDVIGRVTERLLEYLEASAPYVDGLFLAVTGASADSHGWGINAEQFARWVAPFDKRLLQAAADRVRVIHVHGYDLIPAWYQDYPAEVLSWSHNQSQPTLAAVADAGQFVPMGGLDEIGSMYWPVSRVRDNVLDSRRQTKDRIIVGPGCTVHSDTPPQVFEALVAAARMPLA